MSETKNTSRINQFFEEVWNHHKRDSADEFISADAVGHNPEFGTSLDAFKAQWDMLHEAFPDIHIRIDDLVAQGEKVATRWTLTGTHKGEYKGIPPTGKSINVTGMSFDHMVDGQIMEGWDNWDGLGLLEQLGSK